MGAVLSYALSALLPPPASLECPDDMIEREILPIYEAPYHQDRPTDRDITKMKTTTQSTSSDDDKAKAECEEEPQTQTQTPMQTPAASPTAVSEVTRLEKVKVSKPTVDAPAPVAAAAVAQRKAQDVPAVSMPSPVPSSSPSNNRVDVLQQTPELRKMWFEPEWTGFRVRSKNYLMDHAKIPTKEPLMELVWFDLFSGEHEDLLHVCRNSQSFVQKALAQPGHDLPHILALTLLIPGSPAIACVQYFALKKDLAETEANCEAMRLYQRFLADAETFRNRRFKLIPSVLDGPWVVKKSVGNKPVILGNALQLLHFQTPQYLEICVDICSDRVAKHVTGLCRSVSTKIQVAMAFVLEGQESSELPERLLGCVAYDHLDLRHAVPIRNN